ncbi:MAG: aspartate carbamoyltransferase regulatory subunit [Termitinemataceae bacterium]|nr:MAG: aspartate carbamoyltransferase regulatory subunit [Termitinemataceae bacterium]
MENSKMLIIDKIKNGIVIDHIKAGQGVKIFNYLSLEKSDRMIAFVVNALSNEIGKKDIIKIYDTININLDVLGLIDPTITVNIIEDEKIIKKIKVQLPKRVENILMCKNPRCITASEKNIPHIFNLADSKTAAYRCEYCDETRGPEDFRLP